MDSVDFKKKFHEIALANGFQSEFGAWLKESNESVIALILVKSNFGKVYHLRIKVNLKDAFGQLFEKNKEWVKHDIAHIMTGPSQEYVDLFDLENLMKESERIEKLKLLFHKEITPLTDKMLTKSGIIDLYKVGSISLLPAVRNELGLD